MVDDPHREGLQRELTAVTDAVLDQLTDGFETPFDATTIRNAARKIAYLRAADQATTEGFPATAWMIRRLIRASPRRRPRP